MLIFNNLISHLEKIYHAVINMIQQFIGFELHSYHIVKKRIEGYTMVTQLKINMCTNSCIAFTEPFKELDKCPKCHEDRYEEIRKTKKMRPRQQFCTIPLGPLIQAMWHTPEGTDSMRYCDWKTTEIIQIIHGSAYLNTCCEGRITLMTLYSCFHLTHSYTMIRNQTVGSPSGSY
jgi:hypothetical protein